MGAQNSSLSKLARSNWNLEKCIATGTHNSEPRRRLAAKPRKTGDDDPQRGFSPSYSKARRLSSNARSIDSATSVGRPCSYLVVAPQSHSIILLYRKSLRFRTNLLKPPHKHIVRLYRSCNGSIVRRSKANRLRPSSPAKKKLCGHVCRGKAA
jgi:hypothetical protein